MRVFVVVDASGRPLANYPDDIFPPDGSARNAAIPEAAVEVTVEQYVALRDNPLKALVGGAIVDLPAQPPAPAEAPDGPTLGDWRVGLLLWDRLDAVKTAVNAAVASENAIEHAHGLVAQQRLEYSNNVMRADLIQLAPALGFTEDDVEESLWRAAQVAAGDLSGQWPLPVS